MFVTFCKNLTSNGFQYKLQRGGYSDLELISYIASRVLATCHGHWSSYDFLQFFCTNGITNKRVLIDSFCPLTITYVKYSDFDTVINAIQRLVLFERKIFPKLQFKMPLALR